jgi:hypothetical protein
LVSQRFDFPEPLRSGISRAFRKADYSLSKASLKPG